MAKRKYEHRHLITRTIFTTSGDVLYFDCDAKENRTEHMELSGKMDAETFLKNVKPNGIVLMVDNVETESKLYGMSLETFIENADEITED